MMCMSAIFEALGVVSVVPLVYVLLSPENLLNNSTFERIFGGAFGENSISFSLVLFFVFSIVIFSIVLRMFAHIRQVKFIAEVECELSSFLVDSYLRKPYEFFLQSNSADLNRIVLAEVGAVIGNLCVPSLTILSQSMVVLFISIAIILLQPELIVTVIIPIFVIYGGLLVAARNVSKKYGERRVLANKTRFRILAESFRGIKEVKVSFLADSFVKRFQVVAKEFGDIYFKSQLVFCLPRHVLEIFAFCGMLLVVVEAYSSGIDPARYISILAVYVFAGYRLLPALQQLYANFSQMRYGEASANTFLKDIAAPESPRFKDLVSSDEILNFGLRDVSFSYARGHEPILKNISLHLEFGKFVGLVGNSGEGKTTLIDLMVGLLEPSSGDIVVNGSSVDADHMLSFRKKISYVGQDAVLFDASIRENISTEFSGGFVDEDRIDFCAKFCEIDVWDQVKHFGYGAQIGDGGLGLSGGQKQRLGLARALYRNRPLMILDEATSSLDERSELRLLEKLKLLTPNITILMITHRSQNLAMCDSVYRLKGGRLLCQELPGDS